MRESKIEEHLRVGTERLEGDCVKLRTINYPDRLLIFPKKIIYFVELKAPGKKPNPGQAREHRRLLKKGHTVLVLDTIEKVDTFLIEVKRKL